MREALAWSWRGRGWTSPRPSVGCVIVKDGRIIGAGHTQPGHGNPHAEIAALARAREAGEDPRGATAYVTLEPCCHFATTPPCTQALIKVGIARVVSGVIDPNPAINGCGYEQLRAAGIEVERNVMLEECARAQDDFLVHITAGLPFVTLKTAATLDGKIATQSGESKWITGPAARQRAHELRHRHDAVLVGIGTALADDPLLTVRLEGKWKQPTRIVLDSQGRLSLESKLVRSAAEVPLIVATTAALPNEQEEQLVKRGATVWRLETDEHGIVWHQLLHRLYGLEMCSLLIEGGSTVAASALAAGIVHRVEYFIAPLLLGDGLHSLGDFGIHSLQDAPRLRAVTTEQVGDDFLLSGYLQGVPGWPDSYPTSHPSPPTPNL